MYFTVNTILLPRLHHDSGVLSIYA
ncbi:hypothetical protein EMIT051CA3_10704 [Pseudomonas chlororaphis]